MFFLIHHRSFTVGFLSAFLMACAGSQTLLGKEGSMATGSGGEKRL